jgi:hypothetical protein
VIESAQPLTVSPHAEMLLQHLHAATPDQTKPAAIAQLKQQQHIAVPIMSLKLQTQRPIKCRLTSSSAQCVVARSALALHLFWLNGV